VVVREGTTVVRRGIKVVRFGTIVVMVQRPRIEDEVMDRLNEKVGDVIRVDPDKVGDGEKIRILLDECEELEKELEEREEVKEMVGDIKSAVNNVYSTVKAMDRRT